MQPLSIVLLSLLLVLSGCRERDSPKNKDNLSTLEEEFLHTLFAAQTEEGPFSLHYSLRTVFFSPELVSLFGEVVVYDRLPHGWSKYEGKTFYKVNNKWSELTLKDLFTNAAQKEFLRAYCEHSLKQKPLTYFHGDVPLRTTLDNEDLLSFVIDDRFLILFFQPYCVGSGADGPFVVKIPYSDLEGHWNSNNVLLRGVHNALLSRSFISSWDPDNWISALPEDWEDDTNQKF